MAKTDDAGLLAAALMGYQSQLDAINGKIAELRKRLGSGGRQPTARASAPARPKNRISAEGRARIAAAQRRRWAAAKKAGRNTLKTPPAKVRTAAE